MKLQQINEVGYDHSGKVVEERFVIYDMKDETVIADNYRNRSGFSRRWSITAQDGISWFDSRVQAEQYMKKIEEDSAEQAHNYKIGDMTTRQEADGNKKMDKRRTDLKSLVVAKVTVKL